MPKVRSSSGWNLVDGDQPMHYPLRMIYHILARLEDCLSYGTKNYFVPFHVSSDLELISTNKYTPSRLQCLDFINNIDADWLRSCLGDVHILDIGCGKGGYAKILELLNYKSYLGVDACAQNDWENVKSETVGFQQLRCGEDHLSIPEGTNFFFSQSALEHIEHDWALFEELADYCNQAEHCVFQLHLVPAPKAVRMYGPHGWRRYSLKKAEEIIELHQASDAVVFGLGTEHSRKEYYKRYQDNRFLSALIKPFIGLDQPFSESSIISKDKASCTISSEADFWGIVIMTGNKLTSSEDCIKKRFIKSDSTF